MKIYFDKLYRYDRLQEPAGIALPFKEGELKTADRIAITQNGRKWFSRRLHRSMQMEA